MPAEDPRTCKGCGKTKPLSEFPVSSYQAGRTYYSKSCLECKPPKEQPGLLYPAFSKHYSVPACAAESLLIAQKRRCMICAEPETKTTMGEVNNLSQDHDHNCCPRGGRSCGKCLRGFLCDACNRALAEVETFIRPPTDAERVYLRMWQLIHAGIIPYRLQEESIAA